MASTTTTGGPVADEETPLLQGQRSSADQEQPPQDHDEADEFKRIQAASEAIRNALPKSMVVPSMVAAFACLLISAIDATLVIALVGPISSVFLAADRVFWLSSAFMLSSCAFSPIWGRLCNIVGRKGCLLACVLTFGIGTLLCAVAPSMNTLILARGIQGVGAAGIQPSSVIIINDLIPVRSRGMYQATAQLVFSIGFAMGGPLGGFVNDRFGWRFAFIIQIPFILLGSILLVYFLRLPQYPKSKREMQQMTETQGKPLYSVLWTRLDPVGAFLLLTSIMGGLIILSIASEYDLPLRDPRILSGLLTSVALFVAFLLVELRVAKEPLLSMRLLNMRGVSAIYVSGLLANVAGTVMLFYLPFYFLVVLDQTPTQIGIHFTSISIFTLLGSFFSGLVMKKTDRIHWLMVTLSIFLFVSPAYLATWTDTHLPSSFAQNMAVTPYAFTASALFTLIGNNLMTTVGQQEVANAVGLMYFFRSLGAILGTSAMGMVLQSVLKSQLSRRITGEGAQALIDAIRKDVSVIPTLSPKNRQAAVVSYSIGLQVLNITIAALVALMVPFVYAIKGDLSTPSTEPTEESARPSDARRTDEQSQQEQGGNRD